MENSTIYTAVRKSSRILFYVCLAGILILFGLLALNWRYFYNFIRGPFSVDAAALAEITDPATRTEYFVTVKADDVADTGFQRVTPQKDGTQKIDAAFPVILVGERILLVETTRADLVSTYQGSLVSIPADIKTDVMDNLLNQVPELTDVFLPYMLVENNFRLKGIIGLSAGFVFFIGFIIGGLIAIRRMGDPSLHPSIKNIERFGPVDDVIGQMDSELDAPHTIIGSSHLTENWLVLINQGSLEAARFSDIVWIYKQITQNRLYGIRTNKSYSAAICDRLGQQLTFTSTQAKVDEFLAALAERCPQAELGHSEEREKKWLDEFKKDNTKVETAPTDEAADPATDLDSHS